MQLFNIILIVLIILILIIYLILDRLSTKNVPKAKEKTHNFCILIPARDESSVIEGLLLSIKNQTYKINMQDVYVIVEDKKDRTVEISKKYKASVVVRKYLNLKTKGYALDEGIKYIIKKKKKYDAYFIFDADNILDKDFIKNMIPAYDKGYDIVSGYRNTKNGNKSVVAASSSLTFSLINTLFNNSKSNKNKNITLSGTGFYIRGYLIDKFGGFPFNCLTEDYELTMYSTLHNLTTFYNINSSFYDEQPIKYKDTINQRVRWIKGYFSVRKKYDRKLFESLKNKDSNYNSRFIELIGLYPIIIVLIYLLVYIIYIIFNIKAYYMYLIGLLIAIYLILEFLTIFMLIKEKDKLKLNTSMKIKAVIYNPLFILSFIPCALKALFIKNVKWKKVKHGN